jgi:tetratricopeptide (TPR) repeat protein
MADYNSGGGGGRKPADWPIPLSVERDPLAHAAELDRRIASWTEEIERNPNDARNYWWRAKYHFDKCNYKEALSDFTMASKLEPKDPFSRLCQGKASYMLGEYDQAIEYHTQAIALMKNSELSLMSNYARCKFYDRRALVYYAKGEYELAINDYTQSIEISRYPHGSAYLGRGNVYLTMGNIEKAKRDFEIARNLGYENESEAAYW